MLEAFKLLLQLFNLLAQDLQFRRQSGSVLCGCLMRGKNRQSKDEPQRSVNNGECQPSLVETTRWLAPGVSRGAWLGGSQYVFVLHF